MKSKKTVVIFGILSAFLILCGVLLSAIVRWVFSVWKELNVNELVYHLVAPLKGTGDGLVGRFVLNCILPAVVITAGYVAGYILMKGKKRLIFMSTFTVAGILMGVFFGKYAWDRLELKEYMRSQMLSSSFIEDNYVYPDNVRIDFPQHKRNLIYIYMESMETTFADAGNGGDFPKNVIPELTKISEENDTFNGGDKKPNGAYVLPCTDFTAGGMFAATSALPLKLNLMLDEDKNKTLNGLKDFFPGVVALGDILDEAGYNQVLFIGSDAIFGARKYYFSQHGSYEIDDYDYAVSRGWIPSLYKANDWGYEDEKLFEFAKIRLSELALEQEPFNFTMLTVDTHFEDGYLCRLCRDDFDDQYSNVYACSSRQVSDFIDWIKQQDFYEDTAIVLSGDHLTMDSDYCDNVSEDYDRRTYTAYINSAAEEVGEKRWRKYSTMDNFPTTLAAMGAKIEGDRLGLGTNLYSGKDTLIETYGFGKVSDEINKRSKFMEELSAYAQFSDEYLTQSLSDCKLEAQYYYPDQKLLRLNIVDVEAFDGEIEKLIAKFWDNDKPKKVYEADFEKMDESSFSCNLDLAEVDPYNSTVEIYMVTNYGKNIRLKSLTPDPARYNFDEYLKWLKELKGDGDHVIFVSAKDDMSSVLTEDSIALLGELGLSRDFGNAYRQSYIAVLDETGEQYDEMSKDSIHYSGTLSDGKDFSVGSAGYDSGDGSSIIIDGADYSINRRGFNIAVYSLNTGEVISSIEFDTSFGYYVSKDRHFYRVD